MPDEKSLIAKILNTPGTPQLPGGGENNSRSPQPYLPMPWTINMARRIIYDLGKAWVYEIPNDDPKKENAPEFWKFCIEGLNRPKSKLNAAIQSTVAKKEYDQKFLSRMNALDSMMTFLIDSFAVSAMSKSHTDVAEYLEWFYEWTDKLLKLWPENLRHIDGKKNNNPIQTPNS